MSDKKRPFAVGYFALTVFVSAIVAAGFGFTAGLMASNQNYSSSYLDQMPMMGQWLSRFNRQNGQVTDLTRALPEESATIATVKKALPAVVSIVISKDVPVMEQYMATPFGNDPFFRQFFGDSFGVPQYRQNGTEKQKIGAGSGFIVSADGVIVTNRHVVTGEAAEYTAVLSGGRKLPAKVLARGPSNDIAIIKVEAKDLPVIEMGDSDKLEPGQVVVAIGYALGEFGNTVSSGVVSGLQRSLKGVGGGKTVEDLFGVIQTDAAINPGNSGGPLLNLRGQAVGVSVAIVQGSQNIGFALPINDIKKVVASVQKDGKISRPFLGVRFALVNKEIQDSNQLSVDYGAIIVRGAKTTDLAVLPGSPADKAGLVENDIILEVGGAKVTEDAPLDQLLSKYGVGETVKMKVLHKGAEKTITV